MKKYIRVLALVLVLVLASAMFLTACGSKSTSDSSSSISNSAAASSSVAAVPAKKLVIGFSQLGAESDWRTANSESIKKACADAGFELKFSDAQQKQENQIKALRSFIQQKVDYIVLAPVVETGWDAVLKEITDSGIPLILVDRSIKTTDGSEPWVTRIGEDFYTEGKNLAQWVLDNDEALGFKDKKTVNVYELVGTVGSGAAVDRGKAWADTMKGTKYVTVKSQTGDFTQAKGMEVMQSWLKSDKGKIDFVYAHNDMMALGAIQAIEAAGLKPGKDIKLVSIDGGQAGFQAMADGKLECIAECSPLTGPKLIETLNKLVNGETVPKLSYAVEGVFPKAQAAANMPRPY